MKYFQANIFRRWKGFPGGSVVKNPPASAGDVGSLPGLGRSPGEGNDNPLQYSCLENPMDRGTWQAVVYEVARVGHNLVTKQDKGDGRSVFIKKGLYMRLKYPFPF